MASDTDVTAAYGVLVDALGHRQGHAAGECPVGPRAVEPGGSQDPAVIRTDLRVPTVPLPPVDTAARELAALKSLYPEWREDPLVVRLESRLMGPDSGAPVARFR